MNIIYFTALVALLATVSAASQNSFPYKLKVDGNWSWTSSTYYPILAISPASPGNEMRTTFSEGFDTDDLQNFTMSTNFLYDAPEFYSGFFVTMFDIYQFSPSPGKAPADSVGLPYNFFQVVVSSSPNSGTFQVKFVGVNKDAGITCPGKITYGIGKYVQLICRGRPADAFVQMNIGVVPV